MLMTADVRRAYCSAKSRRQTYIELPPEDYNKGDKHKCGLLMVSLYGPRDAAIKWEYEMNDTMTKAGFVKGRASVCKYRHRDKNATAAVHGDDVIMEGEQKDVRMLYNKLEEKCEMNMLIIGTAPHLSKSMKILNRIITWKTDGIATEADTKHGQEIIKDTGVSGRARWHTPVVASPKRNKKIKRRMN